MIAPNQSIKLNVPEKYISKAVIDNLAFDVYYDADCLIKDIEEINRQKREEVNSAEFWNFLKNLVGSVATYYSEAKPNETIGKLSNVYLNIRDFRSMITTTGNGNISDAVKNQAKGYLLDKLIDKSFSDKQFKAISKGLLDFASADWDVNVDLSQYDIKINHLINISSNRVLRRYQLPYDVFFKPHIDFDEDGVPNDIDECKEIAGLSKFNGCTKRIYFGKRKVKYELSLEGGILPYLNYSYDNKAEPFHNKYIKLSFQNSQYLRLTNYFNVGNDQSMIYVPVQLITAKNYRDNSSLNSITYSSNYNFNSYLIGVGYQMKYGTKSFSSDVHFEGGVIHTDYKIGERSSLIQNTNGNQIGFIYDDIEERITSGYFGAGMGFDFDYFTINIKYNWLLSLDESPDNNSSNTTNNKPTLKGQYLQLGIKVPLYRKYILK